MHDLGYFVSQDFWQNVFTATEIIFVAVDLALLGGFIYSLFQGAKFRPRMILGERTHAAALALRAVVFKERWQAVARRFVPGSQDAMRLSIIEADALVDSILKDLGFEGEHMADRLAKITPDSLQSLPRLWRAHRLRNDLVHTPGFTLASADAERTLEDYEAFLKEIKIL